MQEMRRVGPVAYYPPMAEIYQALVQHEPFFVLPNGGRQPTYPKGKRNNLWSTTFCGCLYLQHNPEKNPGLDVSRRMLAGAQVIWIIQDGKYIGKMEDSILYMK